MTFTVNATDAENDNLTYSMIPLPTGATFDNRTGEFTWTSPEAGTYPVTITVTDGSNTVSEGITITVNTLPVLAPIGNKTGTVGTSLTITLSATDADGDTVRYNVIGKPTGSDLQDNIFTWPSPVKGTYDVMFTAADEDGRDIESITITITDPAPTPVVYPPRVAFDADVTIPMILDENVAYENQFFYPLFSQAVIDHRDNYKNQTNVFYSDLPIDITSNSTRDIENIVGNGSKAAVGTYTSQQLKNLIDTGKVGTDIVLLSYASTASTLTGN